MWVNRKYLVTKADGSVAVTRCPPPVRKRMAKVKKFLQRIANPCRW